MSTQADEQRLVHLMIAYQDGDPAAFEQLYYLLCADVRRYFSRNQWHGAMAHDLVQEMFLEVHRSRRTYTPPLPVRPWIFGIARNVLARNRRAAHLHPQGQRSFDVEMERLSGLSDRGVPLHDALDVERTLAALPQSIRDPWLLHHILGFSFGSIATHLGITVMAAKLRSSRASRALRLALRIPRKGQR